MAKSFDNFWTTSGRIDSFEFEIVAPNNYEKTIGYIKGVTGGKLNFGYDTDLKVSGSLDVSSSEYIDTCIVRIHYKPRLSDTQKKDIILATCFAYTNNMKFDKGRYFGSIELVSTLARYTDDVLQQNFTIGKNKTYKSELKRLFTREATGGKYKFGSDVKDKKCTSAKLFENGTAPMEVVQAVAKGLDSRVNVNPKGVMVIDKYFAPSKRDCEYKLPTGDYSVTLPEVEITNNRTDMPNRVAYRCEVSYKVKEYVRDKKGNKVKYTSGENKGKYKTKTVEKTSTVTGKAVVKESSPLHFQNRGRWVTQIFSYKKQLSASKVNTDSKLEAELEKIKKEANSKAASKLSTLTSGKKRYVIECYYLPIECGDVVEFEYIASGLKLHVQAMVENIELDLSVGAKMKVTLKHVRSV
jgi:hypothetical protein